MSAATEPSPAGARRGRFYVLDGVDGCGKTTQARALCEQLAGRARERGAPAPLHLREPGSTKVGERLRALLLDPEVPMGPACETLLFAAARRQMLDDLVEPALDAGRDVVCERFHPSTFAYQAVAGGLDGTRVLELLRGWAGAPAPDLVLLLDVDAEEAWARCRDRSLRETDGRADRMEGRGPAFQQRVAEGYREYAARVDGVRVVAAAGDPADVSARIWSEVQHAHR